MNGSKITRNILIGLVLGILVGFLINKFVPKVSIDRWVEYLDMLSIIFLRMINMIVGPLVLSILTVGIAKLGDVKTLGRLGLKTLGYFYFATIVSLITGLVSVNIFQPGKRINIPLPASGTDTGLVKTEMSLHHFIDQLFPESIFQAMSENSILQIVVFSIFLGVALATLGQKAKSITHIMDELTHVMFEIVGYVMKFAPYAVFGAVASVIAAKGLEVLGAYLYLIICFFATLLFFLFVILYGICLLQGIAYFKLLNYVKEAILLTFSTASSEASMPIQFEKLRLFGVPDKIVSFVLPLGYSFNLDGSMMYMTFATGFIAQAYGIELSLSEQLVMLLTLLVTSKGMAAVPRASLVVIAGTIAQFGIPTEGLVLLFAVDWLLDMGRSATSVAGNAVATVLVAKWEGELGEPMPLKD